MREFQQKKTIQKRIYSVGTLLVLLFVLVLMIKGLYGVYLKEKETRLEVDRVSKQQNELKKRYESIEKGNESLKSQDGIEEEIRNKFDVIKPGEGVVVVVDKNEAVIQQDKQGVLKQFWNSVVNIFKR